MPEEAARSFTVGMLAFPKMTQLDFTGPYEVFARMPDARVLVLWKTPGPVVTDRGLAIHADTALSEAPVLDLVMVPGGPGQQLLMEDEEVLAFLRRQGATAKYVTSVCTGSLVLGAAGLLAGYEATSHWAAAHLLPLFGARRQTGRVVVDRNRISGGGVTAGIDFALRVAAEVYGPRVAQEIQLQMEYDPQPPFDAGSPEKAPADVAKTVKARMQALTEQRLETAKRAAAKLAR